MTGLNNQIRWERKKRERWDEILEILKWCQKQLVQVIERGGGRILKSC